MPPVIAHKLMSELQRASNLPPTEDPLTARELEVLKLVAQGLPNLDIAEHRLPQDGRIELMVQGNPVDLRVSVLPTMFGESVVMRLLDKERTVVELPEAETERRWQATTPQWPIMHAVVHGVTRDQMMAMAQKRGVL